MERGIPCDIRDGLSFLSKEASRVISDWHVRLYRSMPKLYGEGYSYAEKRAGDMNEDSLSYRFMGLGAKSLRAYIVSQGYTTVVCTHLFPAMMLTYLQRQDPLPVQTAFIATDFTASPGYEVVELDWCFVPSEKIIGDFIKPNMPAERIVGSGIPVCRAFYAPADPASARRALGLSPLHRHLLVMSGSMGCGPLRHILKCLAMIMTDDVEISVICGTNRKLSRQLNQRLNDRQNIHIHDFTEHVPLFMDSADLYLTKPGGLSVSEAMARGLPMVLIRAVEGCETHNLRYCLDTGAAVTADTPGDVAQLCMRLIHDDGTLAKMRQAQAAARKKPAAEIVCDVLTQGRG